MVSDIRKKVAASDGAVNADEAYWILDGERAYYWLHATEHYIHFQFDTSRAGGCLLTHNNKAVTLQERINRYADCWLVFLDVQETAKRHGRGVLDVFYRLATLAGKFPDALLRYIYAGPCMAGS